jgi:hypothetical protein
LTAAIDTAREIRAAALEYATVLDPSTRMSVRARTLTLIEKLDLYRGPEVSTRRVSAGELQSDAALRGAIVMHCDLVFRSSVTASEVLFTATRGILRIAEHAQLDGFPIGALLALPTDGLVQSRHQMFEDSAPSLSNADTLMVFALATSPPKLGAGALLMRAAIYDCREYSPPPRAVAFSPLMGLRARVIGKADDEQAWKNVAAEVGDDADRLKEQLSDLLARSKRPDFGAEPAKSWLAAEARTFAASEAYTVGNFHRSMGAPLAGVPDEADSSDSDALWARAYFDYGR